MFMHIVSGELHSRGHHRGNENQNDWVWPLADLVTLLYILAQTEGYLNC